MSEHEHSISLKCETQTQMWLIVLRGSWDKRVNETSKCDEDKSVQLLTTTSKQFFFLCVCVRVCVRACVRVYEFNETAFEFSNQIILNHCIVSIETKLGLLIPMQSIPCRRFSRGPFQLIASVFFLFIRRLFVMIANTEIKANEILSC